MTAHHNNHPGLRGHSVGELYPVVTTQYGDGTHGLMYGGLELRGKDTAKEARRIAAWAVFILALDGYGEALKYLTDEGAKPVQIHGD